MLRKIHESHLNSRCPGNPETWCPKNSERLDPLAHSKGSNEDLHTACRVGLAVERIFLALAVARKEKDLVLRR